MKDFAKSIRVANAKDKNGKDVNVGDLVKVKTDDPSLTLGKVKSVSGETIKVDMTGDDDIWTTPARLVEKVGNKKVGNEAVVLKDFAKSIRTMNSNKEEIIKKKKEEGATLKVDNGQKLEFSDGTTYVKTSFSDDYREAKNYTGNQKVGNEAIVLKDGDVWVVLYANETKSKEFDTEAEARAFAKQVGNKKVGNKYEWTTRNGELQYFDYSVPFGGHKKGSVEKTSGGYTGYKMNGSIIISKKEFQTEEEAKKYVENKKVGNVGEIPPESEISKEIYEELKKNGFDKEKTIVSLSIKYKNIPNARKFFESAVEKVIKSYSNRTVNESIEKQEWSMFKGLSKDAEKEVGNETYQHKLYPDKYVIINGKNYKIITDGKVEKTGELTDAVLYGINQTYKRVSSINSKTVNESILKQEWSMFNGLRKDAEKEIGNGALDYKIVGPKSQPAKYKVGEEVKTNKGKGKILKVQPMMLSPTPTYLIELDNGSKEWRYEEEIGNKKIGNAYKANPELIKILEAWLHNRISEQEARAKIMKITGDKNITDMMIHSPGGFIPAGNKKTGNEKISYPEHKLESASWTTWKYIISNPDKYDENTLEKARKLLETKSGNEQKTNNLCRARNAIKTKNGMGVSDLEAQIRKNKEFIRQQKMRMNGKSKPEQDDIAEGIREAEEEIDRMEMRIAELKETGNKKVGNKKYHVWTDNGSWDMIVDEKELEGLKRTYKNFHYEEVKEG